MLLISRCRGFLLTHQYVLVLVHFAENSVLVPDFAGLHTGSFLIRLLLEIVEAMAPLLLGNLTVVVLIPASDTVSNFSVHPSRRQ